MKHLGDITSIDGGNVPFVDVIIGGSPCQDLSIAGKKAGLAGERSGLFMEQIRIIKEMRRASGATYPRYMVWENVFGAFSSNKGRDFAIVLEETIKIAEPEIPSIEVPTKGWPTWGSYRDMDGRWSVAWRTLDAQYWGTPQRRRRIALVADFAGDSAREILFERKIVSGNSEPCRAEYGGIARAIETGVDDSSGACVFDMTHANEVIRECGKTVPTLLSRMGTGGNQVPLTLTGGDVTGTLMARDSKGVGRADTLDRVIKEPGKSIRRLTPLECERLQGYPDGWTDIGEWTDSKGKKRKKSSDTARYKSLGNSIALPPWRFVLNRIYRQFGRPATMASLFDGIGGFPLIWRELGGETLWASEIEEFPIAVTKRRLNDEL